MGDICSTIAQPTHVKDTNYTYTALNLNIHILPTKIDHLKLMITELQDKNITIAFIMLRETF